MPVLPAVFLLLALAPAALQRKDKELELTSGRAQPKEEACYDVQRYDLAVRVDPAERRITGRVEMTARWTAASDDFVLDLDDRLEVRSVELRASDAKDTAFAPASFQHHRGEIRIMRAGRDLAIGSDFAVRVEYGGKPREAPNPPWDGGFVWSKTASGAPWIATANQMQGADLWWPVKDQPDDEPASMSIRVTVPRPLVVASNGRLEEVLEDHDCTADEPGGAKSRGWRTYAWRVSTPINAYGVALNIAPYETITREYESVAGDTFPVTYWVLPENVDKGKVLFEDILAQMRQLENLYGPYPFRADKYGVAETPHLGMEHQSIIAYGNQYHGNPWGEDYGFDMLHLHEFAHEWWANLVTCANWNDFWIHEGFASYTQALYAERVKGTPAYFSEMAAMRGGIQNRAAVAPREKRSTAEMYFGDRDGSPGGDIYYKGAWILHSLRWLLGDEQFFPVLRRMAYPDPAGEKLTDGSACRFATTDELRSIAEQHTGLDLGWFFELYLRQPELPTLESSVKGDELEIAWKTPGNRPFPMPVEVRVGSELRRVECPGGRGTLFVGRGAKVAVDPRDWVLRTKE
jgi:aminopeptidase N